MTSLAMGMPAPIGLGEKIWRINWGLVLVLSAIAGVGVLALYSAAGGQFEPWAARHAARYGAALLMMLFVALIHPKVWLSLAWPIYIVAMLLLVAVDVAGKIGMGAQRWLVIGPLQIQPSEIAKVAVILVLARYYQGLTREQAGRFLYTLPPLLIILAPVGLVMVQPDLGTALMVLLGGAALLFVAGVRLWMFIVAAIGAIGCLPIAWSFMHDYQRKRVLTFPRSRPRSAGRGLSHHPVEDRDRLGRPDGQGLPEGHAIGAQLPAREADRLHLHHLRRGVGHGWRLRAARLVRAGAAVGLLDRAPGASTISAG